MTKINLRLVLTTTDYRQSPFVQAFINQNFVVGTFVVVVVVVEIGDTYKTGTGL